MMADQTHPARRLRRVRVRSMVNALSVKRTPTDRGRTTIAPGLGTRVRSAIRMRSLPDWISIKRVDDDA